MATYKWALDQRGFKAIPFSEYTEEQKKKCDYVDEYLSPSVQHSRCGWHHVGYEVMESQYGREEYAVLLPVDENDPEIAILIMVDEPSQGVLYGSVIAAPYMGAIMENVLPYIGVEKDVSQDNSVKVPYLTGMTVEEAYDELMVIENGKIYSGIFINK